MEIYPLHGILFGKIRVTITFVKVPSTFFRKDYDVIKNNFEYAKGTTAYCRLY